MLMSQVTFNIFYNIQSDYHIETVTYDGKLVATNIVKDWKKSEAGGNANAGGGTDPRMAAALLLAGGASLADGPLPIGEAIGVGIIAVTAAKVYGPALVAKMNKEIDRIANKAQGPQGVLYALVANHSGFYPNVRGGTTFLNVGDVWKYGETTDPSGRYYGSYLRGMGLEKIDLFPGSQMEIKIQEKIMLYGYFMENGTLPPGNSIFR